MARKIMIAAAPNYVPDLTVVALGTTAAGMAASQLQTDEPSELCRITTCLDITKTGWSFKRTSGGDVYPASPWLSTPVHNVFAAINHNFTEGTAATRVLYDTSGTVPWTKIAPNSIEATTNITGAVTSIDDVDPLAPDGLTMPYTVGGATPTALRVGFPTPAANLRTGAGLQMFRVTGRVASIGGAIVIKLYEAGAAKATLATHTLGINDTPYIMHGQWDASLLSAVSGVNVECHVESSVGMTIDAIEWLAETTASTYLGDSGWVTTPQLADTSFWGSSRAAGLLPNRNLFYAPSAPITADAVQLLVRDVDNISGPSGSGSPGLLAGAGGYVQFGVAVAGPAFFPSRVNASKGPLISARDPSLVGYTLGGQEIGSRRRPRRVMPVELSRLTEAEGWSLFDRLDWMKGRKVPCLVVRYPDDTTSHRHTALWATLEDMPGLSLPSAYGRHSWAGTFVEKL